MDRCHLESGCSKCFPVAHIVNSGSPGLSQQIAEIGLNITAGICVRTHFPAVSIWLDHRTLLWAAPHARDNVQCRPERLDQPLHWRRPRKIFVSSLSGT